MEIQVYMRKIFAPVVIVIFFVGIIMFLLAFNTMHQHNAENELEAIKGVPDFTLVNQFNEEVSRDDFFGYVLVVNFIFTNCGGICPTMTFQMRELQDSLTEEIPVRFISITVDPARDTPDMLRAYAEENGADSDRWLFLTGDSETIYSLSREGFLLGVNPEGGSLREPIMHSQRFVLVDDNGMIRDYYDGFDEEELDRLRQDIKYILRGQV